MAKTLMIQGTMSNAGKSIITAGLCRIFHQDGYKVAPFKSQNMALNSFITKDGLEMGRAQVVQAEACGKEPDVRMNPLLLKPVSNMGSQIILNGEVVGNLSASDFYKQKHTFLPQIEEAFRSLATENDIIVIEGAGSPAEINLKTGDFVNMGMAKIAKAPVILVGDIDRGGVFAQLFGTIGLLPPDEQDMIKACLINKFRGNVDLLKNGLDDFSDLINKPFVGVLPYLDVAIEDEDSLSHTLKSQHTELIDIAVIRLPRLSNFTDFAPLATQEGVGVRYVSCAHELGNPDLLILPGTKNTIDDLLWLRQNGLEGKIKRLAADGKPIIGVCGGYQMLGEQICDEAEVEGGKSVAGMGLLPITTQFATEKHRTRVSGVVINNSNNGDFSSLEGTEVEGYEIHMGVSTLLNNAQPWLKLSNQTLDGCSSGNIYGTYLHGFFDASRCRQLILEALATKKGINLNCTACDYEIFKQQEFDKLAIAMRKHCDIKAIYRILEEGI